MWSDPNLAAFMAVTAHWIEAVTDQTALGPRTILKLRVDLVGFQRVPDRHTGQHLADAFIHLIDCLGVAQKVSIHTYIMRHLCLILCVLDWLDNNGQRY